MQLKTSKIINFFDNPFRNKFGFERYTNVNKPTVFFGIYTRSDVKSVELHNGLKIVWLAGSDASNEKVINQLKNNKAFSPTIIIAESKWIRDDLDRNNIPYRSISLCMDDLYNWHPEPLGTDIYWYNAGSSKYGKQYLDTIRKEFSDINIITNDSKTCPREEMSEIYKKCFCGIRPVVHDGQSQTVAEMALMGRMSVYNGDGPFSIPYKNVDDMIAAIRYLRDGYNWKLTAKRARGFFIKNETKWADLIFELCGTDEIDVTGIFHKDEGRCASLFRIQRKSDIERIGGILGRDQFERPWFSEQMKKLGKKQLITSKNSGYVISEYKGVGNKGYPKDFKEFQTYDKRYN